VADTDPIRVASFNVELMRDGPGLLLRDIDRGDPQVEAVVAIIAEAAPDVLALQRIDWDYGGRTLAALQARLAAAGHAMPHRFAARPNAGLATDLDLNGDGRRGRAEDAQGFGRFMGQGGIAVLSRFPIQTGDVVDFTDMLWRDLPDPLMPTGPDGGPFPSDAAWAAQRLSSTAHWVVPVALPDGDVLRVMTFQAGPPVFDGPEDRNGRRNHDEVRFWSLYLDGGLGVVPQDGLVLAGGANQDPVLGDGLHDAITGLLTHPRLIDPDPQSVTGGPATVEWDGVGRLRVDYVLPSTDWTVTGSGVVWPEAGAPLADAALVASRHRLVWVDLVPAEDRTDRRP
jgi:hypothetical protein